MSYEAASYDTIIRAFELKLLSADEARAALARAGLDFSVPAQAKSPLPTTSTIRV